MNKPSLVASSAGNIIEWYDFALFIYLGPVISHNFFPVSSPAVTSTYWFGVFALGFLCRPLGGVLLGHFGDRVGRAKVLRFSMWFITIPTLLISVLPTYAQIGIFSPIALIFLRLVQGVCIGGEYSGIMIYLAEMSEAKHRAFITSFAATGANIGLLLGISFVIFAEYFFTKTQFSQFGWRIAFLLGGVLGCIILQLRMRLLETPVFKNFFDCNSVAKTPLLEAIKKDYRVMFKIVGLISFGGTLFYTTFTYLGSYLLDHGDLSLKEINFIQVILVFIMLFLVPVFGLLCDYIGKRNIYKFLCGLSLLIMPLIFYFLNSHVFCFVVFGLVVLTVISSMEQATTLVTVVDLVPLRTRYTTLALSYNVGNVFFGGVTPIVLTSIIHATHNRYVPAMYLMMTALLTLIVAFLFVNNPSVDGGKKPSRLL